MCHQLLFSHKEESGSTVKRWRLSVLSIKLKKFTKNIKIFLIYWYIVPTFLLKNGLIYGKNLLFRKTVFF